MIRQQEFGQILNLYESIQLMTQDYAQFYQIIFRLRKIITSLLSMVSAIGYQESLEKISRESCECLQSQQCHIYLHDS